MGGFFQFGILPRRQSRQSRNCAKGCYTFAQAKNQKIKIKKNIF